MKELSRLDAPAAAILMFPPPPTQTVCNPPTAERRAMFMLLEVVMILGLGVVVLTVEVKFDVVRIDVLMGVWEVAGRMILIGDGVPEALTVMPRELS